MVASVYQFESCQAVALWKKGSVISGGAIALGPRCSYGHVLLRATLFLRPCPTVCIGVSGYATHCNNITMYAP